MLPSPGLILVVSPRSPSIQAISLLVLQMVSFRAFRDPEDNPQASRKPHLNTVLGITVDQAVVLIGVLVLLIFIVVTSIGIKVFCCRDKRKFRSSKDVKCVRHQESMTSPLDSPLRSVISIATNGQQMTVESEQDNLIRNKERYACRFIITRTKTVKIRSQKDLLDF